MQNTKMSAFSIAMALVGTLIGAGYASGQELMQFFGAFGAKGIIGIVIALVFFFQIGRASCRERV